MNKEQKETLKDLKEYLKKEDCDLLLVLDDIEQELEAVMSAHGYYWRGYSTDDYFIELNKLRDKVNSRFNSKRRNKNEND